MKTFKSMNPIGQVLDSTPLQEFIKHQKDLLQLLSRSKDVDLNKVKTGISISKWIKLKLGDTYKVVIFHNERHIMQALRATEQK